MTRIELEVNLMRIFTHLVLIQNFTQTDFYSSETDLSTRSTSLTIPCMRVPSRPCSPPIFTHNAEILQHFILLSIRLKVSHLLYILYPIHLFNP